VPGVFSQGETMAELEENIRDAYKMMMETEVLPKLSMKPQEKEVDITL